MILVRIARWASSLDNFDSTKVGGVLHNWDAFMISVSPKVSFFVAWSLPGVGELKFNVDGAARGKPGLVGIGGVLRDSASFVFGMFSKHVGIKESNKAEVLAIL